jgi:hypothetical protein
VRHPKEWKKYINTVKAKRTHRNSTVLVKKSNRKGEPVVIESISELEFTTTTETSRSEKE